MKLSSILPLIRRFAPVDDCSSSPNLFTHWHSKTPAGGAIPILQVLQDDRAGRREPLNVIRPETRNPPAPHGALGRKASGVAGPVIGITPRNEVFAVVPNVLPNVSVALPVLLKPARFVELSLRRIHQQYKWRLDSRAKCNGSMRTGFARLCQAL